jgi:Na+/H+-dicarboxylate symporter
MRMLFMTVMPLLLSVLALGVAEIGDIRRIGRQRRVFRQDDCGQF